MSPIAETTIAFVGAGAMGEAMIAGLLDRQMISQERVMASDPRVELGQELAKRYGIRPSVSNLEAAEFGQILIFAVKPQILSSVMKDLKGKLRPDQLVMSIVAGASSHSLSGGLAHDAIVRIMPNTPAQIGHGISVWTVTSAVTEQQRTQAKAILSALGSEIFVDDEEQVDMATAISGTGPAYFFLVMEALIDAGVHLGFSRRIANELVIETMLGSVLFAKQSMEHPAQLRNLVTSPAGTSAEAIYQLEKGGLRTVLSKAVYAAYQRTKVLGEIKKDEEE
jgi:pyrroline-5-carboxylate reductase